MPICCCGFWILNFFDIFFLSWKCTQSGGLKKGAGLQSFFPPFLKVKYRLFLSFLFPLTDPFRDAWSFDRPSNRLAATDDFPLFPSLFLGAQHCFLYPPVRHFSCSWPLPPFHFAHIRPRKKREAMKTKLVRLKCMWETAMCFYLWRSRQVLERRLLLLLLWRDQFIRAQQPSLLPLRLLYFGFINS